MPMAVRCAPGMECARYPNFSIFSQTARTCSSVACACMTTNIDSPWEKDLMRAAAAFGPLRLSFRLSGRVRLDCLPAAAGEAALQVYRLPRLHRKCGSPGESMTFERH